MGSIGRNAILPSGKERSEDGRVRASCEAVKRILAEYRELQAYAANL